MQAIHTRWTAYVLIFTCAVFLTAGQAHAINIIFYGNSFTNGLGSTKTVPTILSEIAVAAGNPAPYMINAAVNGQSFSWHLANNLSPITTAIAPGQQWDYAVLQDFSTAPTHIGSVALHRSTAVSMRNAVAAHSPGVTAVMFETWARAPGHSYYPGTFASPAVMQQEVRDGYMLSTGDINAAAGAGSAVYAPVGDAWENANWNQLHSGDLYHAQNRGSLLTALVLYAKIYDDPTTSDINLAGILSGLGLTSADGLELTGVADATLVPEPATFALLGATLCLVSIRRR
jgi:hypothetical protein